MNKAEGAGEQQRREDAGQADQAHQRALDATLRVGADLAGDQRLRGRAGQRPTSALIGRPIRNIQPASAMP